MAEFSELIERMGRMCSAIIGNRLDCKGNCGLANNPVCGDLCKVTEKDIQEAERVIMKWDAEHPGPVYPTWEEWLITQGVIKENPNGGIGLPMPKLLEHIHADTAQKLGIEPKEGI